MRKQVAQYLYDIADLYTVLYDNIDGITDAHILNITDVAFRSFLRNQLQMVSPIDELYAVLSLYTDDGKIADIVSELIEWYENAVGRHLRSVAPPDCQCYFDVKQRVDLVVTFYEPVPLPTDEVGKIKQLIRNDLDNGDFYPETIRHALGFP